MSEKEYIVVVKRGIDLNEIDAEMQSSSGNDIIPQRAVDVANPRVGSKRMTHYALTDEEAAQLSNDPRVLSVEIPPEQREDINIGLHAQRFNNYDKPATSSENLSGVSQNFVNWGLVRSNQITNGYSGTNNATSSTDYFNYVLDGTGVDVVIQDSGIEANHPEWEDANGNSRLNQIDWYTASGVSGTQNANHYRDYDGHGTHVASIAVGKEFGWAKNAQIYSQKLSGLEGPDDGGTGISTSDAFDTIRLWHNAKTNGRPTVVNMSWGYSWSFPNTGYTNLGGTYRGTGWNYGIDYNTQSDVVSNTGFNPPWTLYGTSNPVPSRVASIDADVEDMIDAGIHICIASGNQGYKIEAPGGLDANNSVSYFGTRYYHRGSSPYTDEAFIVGNIAGGDTNYSGSSTVAPFRFEDGPCITSNYGPGVNIWAPGRNIVGACSTTNDKGDGPYSFNPSFRQTNIGGTSMASPQVAGVCALFLQSYPNLTPAQLQKMIFDYSQSTVNFNQTGSTDYDVYPSGSFQGFSPSSCGGPNRYLFNPYNKATPVSAIGSGSITGMKLVV